MNTDGTDAVSSGLSVPACALAIGAHPDDIEFGAGATLARWAAAGCRVHHVVLTDGSKGTWDPNADTVALAERRQQEQRDAAAIIAAPGGVTFFEQIDGALSHSAELVGRLAAVIRTVRPTVVLGHDPWKRYRLHPDHRVAGQLVCDAIVAARDPHFYPEQRLAAHRPDALLLWEADEVNHVEDITDIALGIKLAALEAHTSQFESTMKATNPQQLADFRQRITDRLTANGLAFGRGPVEAFHLMTDL